MKIILKFFNERLKIWLLYENVKITCNLLLEFVF